VGSQIAGVVVDLVGLEPGAMPDEVGPGVVQGLGLSLGLSVLCLVGFSIAIFSRYDLARERHTGVRAQLDARESVLGDVIESRRPFSGHRSSGGAGDGTRTRNRSPGWLRGAHPGPRGGAVGPACASRRAPRPGPDSANPPGSGRGLA
jgi:hypothetical protein